MLVVVVALVVPPVLSWCLNIMSDATDDEEDSRNNDLWQLFNNIQEKEKKKGKKKKGKRGKPVYL